MLLNLNQLKLIQRMNRFISTPDRVNSLGRGNQNVILTIIQGDAQ